MGVDVDFVAGVISFVLTLMVLSYLIGDNPLYRIAVSLFVGASAGFIAMTVTEWLWNYWVKSVILGPETGPAQRLLGVMPLVFGLTLLFKFSRRMAKLGNLTVAYLVGVGTAVALVGIITGTLLPQVRAAGDVTGVGTDAGQWVNGLIMAVGTICTLLYFQFVARRRPDGEMVRPLPLRIAALVGQGFIVVALAALYAGAIVAGLSVFAGVTEGFVVQFLP
ncbi:MAG: hypothetical protein JXB47_21495 [Anaerolineae bacterium]|nr:hypothetical protein [Anaerolineae bacterium]